MADFYSSIPSVLRSYVIENVQLGREICKGINSTILEAQWEGTTVAVKQIHLGILNEQEQERIKGKFLIECDQSNRLRHSNIVRFLGLYLPPQAKIPSVVMEYHQFTLDNLLEQNSTILLEIKMSFLHQIGLGLRYLHARVPSIVRGNLTSKSILISRGMEVKIADLGTTRFFDPVRRFGKISGNSKDINDFMAPEKLANNPNIQYGKESDIFSFGCVILHTLSHQWPKPLPLSSYCIQSEKERRTQYFGEIPKEVENVMLPLTESCLENLPFDRPTVSKVCDHLLPLVVNTLPDNLLQVQRMLHDAKCQLDSQAKEICDKEAEIQSLKSMPQTTDSLQSSKKV